MLINGIFEGGGIKGLAYIGALRFLEERGFQFHRVGGTSIGAIIASLISVGYNSYELEEIVNNFDINIVTYNKETKRLSKIIGSIKQKGIYSIEKLEEYLYALNKAKGKLYFKDVKLGNSYLLKIIVTDYKKRKMIVLPEGLKEYGYNPDMFLISKAAVMSSTMPIVFSPYIIGDNTFFDGGIVDNFPITLFSDSTVPTIGFKLNESIFNKKVNVIQRYRNKVFNANCIYDFDKYNVIDINTKGFRATDFKKGYENRNQLYLSGYNSMRKYFYSHFQC